MSNQEKPLKEIRIKVWGDVPESLLNKVLANLPQQGAVVYCFSDKELVCCADRLTKTKLYRIYWRDAPKNINGLHANAIILDEPVAN